MAVVIEEILAGNRNGSICSISESFLNRYRKTEELGVIENSEK